MSVSATDPDAPRRTAAGWALVCGVFAGALWAVCWGATGAWREFEYAFGSPNGAAGAAIVMALLGGFLGFVAGTAVGVVGLFRRHSGWDLLNLVSSGMFFGSIGCGLAVFVAAVAHRHIHPLLSSSLTIAGVGFLVGFMAAHPTPAAGEPGRSRVPVLAADTWALVVAIWAGAVWAGACLLAGAVFDVPMPFDRTSPAGTHALGLAALGAVYGVLGGALVGLCHQQRGERGQRALILGFGGLLFGALGGGLSALAVGAFDRLHPIVSSSLAMTAVGFVAGLCGCLVSRWLAEEPQAPEEEDESAAPPVTIEWLLREAKRRWRLNRALERVLPVLAVSAAASAGAAVLIPSEVALALLAVALLGLAVSWVLYHQELRLEVLERRPRG